MFLLGFNSAAASDATFLEAIAQVESGMNRKAIGKAGERGMYQVGKAAWDYANALLQYLGTKPYVEVAGLIAELQKQVAPQLHEQETAQ